MFMNLKAVSNKIILQTGGLGIGFGRMMRFKRKWVISSFQEN